MNAAILTFQFAHNYGALLQAYALSRYLKGRNIHVEIAPYNPEWAQAEYAISPLAKGIPPRRRIRLALQYPRRKKQSQFFEQFIAEELNAGDTFATEQELYQWLDRHDCVVCGSDQIWNNRITGDGAAYYAAGSRVKKVSYAASLGTAQLSAAQKKNMEAYLPQFSALSVREPGSAEKVEQLLHKPVQVVLDPVFLLEKEEWMKLARPVDVDPNFLFLYFLQEDEVLLRWAQTYAKEHGLKIYEVHPTMAARHAGCKRLDEVGPKEFVWLIQNAACVCTNSFHATAFSTIYKKKLLHIPNSKSPERTISLLQRAGITLEQGGKMPLYDLALYDGSSLEREIEKSKAFLDAALREDTLQ